MNDIQYKKLFVLLRRVLRLFYKPKKDFDKQYYNSRVKAAVYEVMYMDVNERFKFVEEIKSKVLQETINEKEKLLLQINKINETLLKYEKV
jgi:hypothetical protein